jgi:hypothetical protein
MRIHILPFLFAITCVLTVSAQRFPISWYNDLVISDSLTVLKLSSSADMRRLCIFCAGKGKTKYVFVADRMSNDLWSQPYLALSLDFHSMHAAISADGNRIYLTKLIDEHTGVILKEVSPGVTYTANDIGIYVTDLLTERRWSALRTMDDWFVFSVPPHSFSVSPSETNLLFSLLLPGKKDQVDFLLYRSEKNSQNKWAESTQVSLKGITLGKRLKENAIAGPGIVHQDDERILINGYDGQYISKYDGVKYSDPVKLEFGGSRVHWLTSDGSIGLILSDSRPTRIGAVALKPARATALVTSPAVILSDVDKAIAPSGKYYAVLIGVSKYQNPKLDLDRPGKDVDALKSILTSQYTFAESDVVVLQDPTRQQILNLLFRLRQTITEKDNLLIFYAGHGHLDKSIQQGYWWPRDAQPDDPSNWLSNSDLREQIRGIPSAHTLLISDACFSGGIFRTRGAEEIRNAPIDIVMLYKTRSRRAMTSGNMSSVPDESVFFNYLARNLNSNRDKFVSSQQLFARLQAAVINNSLIIPRDGVITDTGDEGGDFIFIRQ